MTSRIARRIPSLPTTVTGDARALGARLRLSRCLRGLGPLLLALMISACGGGSDAVVAAGGASGGGGGGAGGGGGGGGGAGGGGGSAAVATLEVVPGSATVGVGGAAQYRVVAWDANGQMIAAPALTWTAATPAVGTIGTDGLATGASVGQTTIIASAGGVSSQPAVLNVVVPRVPPAGACDGIASVQQWDARVYFDYSDYYVNKIGATVLTDHAAYVAAALMPAGTVSGKLQWIGELVGADPPGHIPGRNIYVNEQFDDHISDPTELVTLKGLGQPVPTPGVDGMRLEVDPANCTFQFYVTPSGATTLSKTEHAVNVLPGPDEGTFTYQQDMPLGILQRGITPLGPWRESGVGDYTANLLYFSSYSNLAIPVGADAYISSGLYGQTPFIDSSNLAPRSASFGGRVRVNYSIRAH
jgi:hypothetical protein